MYFKHGDCGVAGQVQAVSQQCSSTNDERRVHMWWVQSRICRNLQHAKESV